MSQQSTEQPVNTSTTHLAKVGVPHRTVCGKVAANVPVTALRRKANCPECVPDAEVAPSTEQTLQQALAAELHRIADDIVRLNLPLKDTMCGGLSLGALASRADLERWADYLGTAIEVNSANDIPSVRHRVLLDGGPYGAWLDVHAQINPEGPSEVERLRAEVAELRAQVAGGAR
jgi:hypothetical protein